MLERVDTPLEAAATLPFAELAVLQNYAAGDSGRLQRMITRRGFGEPLAYVVGEVEKQGMPFFIDRRCYIPDDDTQLLVDELIRDAHGSRNRSILEFGTGCGWIAISLKLSLPAANVIACDIDPSVLDLARTNSRRHRANVHFFESSYAHDLLIAEPEFIIADLPYGGDATYSEEEIRDRPFLPPVSVYPREGAMQCYIEAIASVRAKGWQSKIYMETGYLSEERVKAVLGEEGEAVEYRQIKEGYSVTVVDMSKANALYGATS